jgi:hypothetical protein
MNSNNRSRKRLENELQDMKRQINQLTSRNMDIHGILQEKVKSDEIGSNFLALYKHMDLVLKNMSDKLETIGANINAEYYEQEDQDPQYPQENKLAKVQPISGLDAQILQIVQRIELACADDIKKQMSYKGRNAASARLNRLYKIGLLERYQLGHKVYYKYDAGKTTNTLIVSPPR